MASEITLLHSPHWVDYELLDSGDGLKLERFGPYCFVRPEVQALWRPRLPAADWDNTEAVFQATGEESGGHWLARKPLPPQWEMKYRHLRFEVMTTPGRHLGVFPECAAHWDWMAEQVAGQVAKGREVQVLNLFGYTGLATLACAAAGAKVTHVDASKKSVAWARRNQELSKLADRPIRWIVDDALKYVEREARRGSLYDGILLDPPKFGRGPKGEVWEVYHSLPRLLAACRQVLRPHPLFVVLTVYAVKLPAVHARIIVEEMTEGFGGKVECGELVTVEKSGGRSLSQAVYARWMERG